MKYYTCYMYLGDPADESHWSSYQYKSKVSALTIYNKWLAAPKDEVTGFGVVEMDVDGVTGAITTSTLHHHVNPLPKKVIYNQVAGLKAKKPVQVFIEPIEEVPALPEAPVNWAAVHQAFN